MARKRSLASTHDSLVTRTSPPPSLVFSSLFPSFSSSRAHRFTFPPSSFGYTLLPLARVTARAFTPPHLFSPSLPPRPSFLPAVSRADVASSIESLFLRARNVIPLLSRSDFLRNFVLRVVEHL